jgi:hypothetical protein
MLKKKVAPKPKAKAKPKPKNWNGRYVLCRCYSAGVHAGYLVSQDKEQVVLKNSRRLWYWKSDSPAVALSGVAQSGLASGCKVDVINPEILLNGVIEVIPCSANAEKSINGY